MNKPSIFSVIVLAFTCLAVIGCRNNQKEQTSNTVVSEDTLKKDRDTIKKSIPAIVSKSINGTDVIIQYNSPAVQNRDIWGALVPYDSIWVTGAHQATSLSISKDFTASGKNIPAGKYAIFTIPGREEWTIILNRNWNQHLADEYNAADDIVRIQVKPEVSNKL